MISKYLQWHYYRFMTILFYTMVQLFDGDWIISEFTDLMRQEFVDIETLHWHLRSNVHPSVTILLEDKQTTGHCTKQ